LARLQNLALSKAFDAWLTLSVRRRYVRSVCKKSLARLQNLAVSRAWSAWWSLRCLMVRVRAMMTRMRNRVAVSCVHAWSGCATRRRRLRSLRTKCLVKMLQRVLVTAFDAWMELANAQTVRRASESRLLGAMRGRWRRGALFQCFHGWKAWLVQLKSVRSLLTSSKQRVDRTRKSRALMGWAGYRAYRHMLKERYMAFAQRRNQRLLAWGHLALLSWCRVSKTMMIAADRVEIATKVAELRAMRAEREMEVRNLVQKFNAKASALSSQLTQSNAEMEETRTRAEQQQRATAERNASEQAAASRMLDDAVSAAERNAARAAEALTSRLDAVNRQPHAAAEAVSPTAAATAISREQAQHVRELLRKISATGPEGGPAEPSPPSQALSPEAAEDAAPISLEQARHVRSMLQQALSPTERTLAWQPPSPEGPSPEASPVEPPQPSAPPQAAVTSRHSAGHLDRRTVWMHALAKRRQMRMLDESFERWVQRLIHSQASQGAG